MKVPLKKFGNWLLGKPLLLYALLGLAWGILVGGVMLVRENIILGKWNLPGLLAKPGDVIANFEEQSIDFRFHLRGTELPPPDIVIVAIDDQSFTGSSSRFDEEDFKQDPDLRLLSDYPYPRRAWAKIVQKLADAGAKTIAIDVVFAQPSRIGPEDDLEFKKVVEANRDILVLGGDFQPPRPGIGSNFLIPNEVFLESFDDMSEIVGVVNYDPGSRSVVRVASTDFPEAGCRAFAALAANKAGYKVESDLFWINYTGNAGTFPTISLYKLFFSPDWSGRINAAGETEGGTLEGGKFFKDKIVLIGATAGILQDFHVTPFGKMPGVEVHANTISNYYARQKMRHYQNWPLVLAAGVFQGFLLSFFARPLSKLAPMILFLLGIIAISYLAFVKWHVVTPLYTPCLIAMLTALSIIFWQATSEFLARQKTRKTLETYVSPNVAAFILQNQNAFEAAQAGQRKPCTILFSDIRGFTTMTESSKDETELVNHLNEYLTEMVHCVFEHGGTLHKFIGDAVMAVWGDTHSEGEKKDALAAVKTALSMRQALAKLNEKWISEGRPTLKIGIGLNHGVVVVGAIGSKEAPLRLEFTVIGDAVNTASRVESETKNQGVDILISRSVRDFVQEEAETESRGEISLKGKAGKVELFHLKGLK